MSIIVPPIKCQGIKTKLVPQIKRLSQGVSYKRWVEPFMGSGVVAFNMLPDNALLCDSNPHLIAFYSALQADEITEDKVREYLEESSILLRNHGETYYYEVRERFNDKHSPLDFLFLNRACFNGVMRFNSKGGFNVPFCRKPERFAQAYITKIVNQVSAIRKILKIKKFEFICQDFRKTFSMLNENDFLYCDPPYIDRHTDYFNQWSDQDETALFLLLEDTSANFIFSTWKCNEFRTNKYIEKYSSVFYLETLKHFYHIGGEIANRHAMEEALLTNFLKFAPVTILPMEQQLFSRL